MGLRIDTLVFPRFNRNENEINKIISQLIEQPLLTPKDFYEEINIDINNEVVIINNFPALNIIHNAMEWEKVFTNLGLSSEWLVALVYFDFSDSYGYTIYEKNCHLRTLFYSADEPDSMITIGSALSFEKKYLHSPIIYLNAEDGETTVTDLENVKGEKDCYFPAIIIDEKPMFLTEAYIEMFSQCSVTYLGVDLSQDYIDAYQHFSISIERNYFTELMKEINEKNPPSLFNKILGFFKNKF